MDQFPFDEGFENGLLARLTRDREFFTQNSSLLKETYFQSTINQIIFGYVSKYYATYTEPMTLETLNNEITKHFEYSKKPSDSDEAYLKKYENYLDKIEKLFAIDLSAQSEKYCHDVIVDFVKRKELERVILEAAGRITKGQPLDPIAQEMAEVLKIGEDALIVLSKLRTCDDVNEDVKDEDKWIIKGLIAKKAINVWYGPPGCGKSHLLWFIGNHIHDGSEPFPRIFWQPAQFIYFDLENSESVRGHIKKVCGGGPMPLVTLEDDIKMPMITDEEKFKTFILSLPPGVIIIDTLAMVVNSKGWVEGKWNVTPVIKVLNELKAKGYTFVLILHTLKADPKNIKSPQELLAQADHVVAVYPTKSAGETEEKEVSEDDPNKPKILFCGTRADLKSRYDKSIYWLRFDPNPDSSNKGFKMVERDAEALWDIRERFVDWVQNQKKTLDRKLEITDYPNREAFENMLKNWGYSQNKARGLILQGYKQGYWNFVPVKSKGQSYHHYYPNPERLIKTNRQAVE